MYNRNFYKAAAYRRQMEKRAYLTNLGVELIKLAADPAGDSVSTPPAGGSVSTPPAGDSGSPKVDKGIIDAILGYYDIAKGKAGAGYDYAKGKASAGYNAVKDFGMGHYSDFMNNPFGEGKKLKDAGRLAAVLGAAGLLGYGGYRGIKALMGPGGPSEEELAMQAAAAQAAEEAARRKKLMRNLGIGAGIATVGGLGYMATRKRNHDRD